MARERDLWTVGCRFSKLIPLVIHKSHLPPSLVPLDTRGSPLPPILVQLEAHEFPSPPRLILLEAHGLPSPLSRFQRAALLFCHPHESETVLAFCFGT